jgi:hypothetical protein
MTNIFHKCACPIRFTPFGDIATETPGHPEVNNHPQSGWLELSCCGDCRRQENTEARLCFDVELAVATGLGKNRNFRAFRLQCARQIRFMPLGCQIAAVTKTSEISIWIAIFVESFYKCEVPLIVRILTGDGKRPPKTADCCGKREMPDPERFVSTTG